MGFSWGRVLAGRAAEFKPSVFVDLGDVHSVPDLIFFGGGVPPVEQLPAKRLGQIIADVWREDATCCYTYDENQGHRPLRETIAERMLARDVEADPDNIVVTNGSQQGLDLIARTLFEPGDVVIIEGPAYFGAIQIFDAYQVQYRIAPIDEHGLIPEELERLVAEEPRPKAIYTVPIFQNPTGVTIPEERRRRIVEIAHEANVVLIEDDPYGELYFGDAPTPPLRAYDPNVIYLGTFSKTLAPSLRIGWMVVPPDIVTLLVDAKEAVDIQSDRFMQRAIVRITPDGWFDRHVEQARQFYARRCRHMLSALEREMPEGTSWTVPAGGFFLWVTLPDAISAMDLVPIAADERVGFLPGSCFYPDIRPTSNLRLGFVTNSEECIDTGIHRLGCAIRKMIRA